MENVVAAVLVRRHPGFTFIDGGYLLATAVALCLTVPLVAAARLLAGDTAVGLAVAITLGLCVFGIGLWRFRTALGVHELVGVLRERTP